MNRLVVRFSFIDWDCNKDDMSLMRLIKWFVFFLIYKKVIYYDFLIEKKVYVLLYVIVEYERGVIM